MLSKKASIGLVRLPESRNGTAPKTAATSHVAVTAK